MTLSRPWGWSRRPSGASPLQRGLRRHPTPFTKKPICLSRCAVRLHIAGPRCSPRTRDPSRCRWQQIKIAVNHRRAHNTSINAPADKGFAGSQGPRLNGTAEEILFQWLSTHGSGAGVPESRRRKSICRELGCNGGTLEWLQMVVVVGGGRSELNGATL